MQQRQDAHHAGQWEFPGGKVEPNESEREALIREWHEELAVEITPGARLGAIEHQYPHVHVQMAVYAILKINTPPTPSDGQPLIWVSKDEAGSLCTLAVADQKVLRLMA